MVAIALLVRSIAELPVGVNGMGVDEAGEVSVGVGPDSVGPAPHPPKARSEQQISMQAIKAFFMG